MTHWPTRSFSCIASLGPKLPFIACSFHPSKTKLYLRYSTTIAAIRGPYNYINQQDKNNFYDILKHKSRLLDDQDVSNYVADWHGYYHNNTRNFTHIALRPTTTQMVAAIMKHCYKRNLAVVPQGGNTGLVGGGTPVFDEIVLSTSLMDDIINFDPQSGILICQAGCILKNLQDYAGNYGFTMPIDLGARGSCQIGGNLSTNAGGIHFVRYGPLRRYVTGVEVVLSNGVVLDMITPQPMQDSDFKQLFIGAEGTLAILTKVAIKCVETAKCYSAIMLGCKTHHQVTSVLMDARNVLGHTVSAIEVMDSAAVSVVDSKLGLKCPLSPHPFYALIETFSNDEDQNIDKLSHILSLLENKFGSMESAVSLNQTQLSQLWSVREHITEALKRDGHVYKFDISVPIAKYFDLVDVMRHEIGSYSSTICGFGHLADGNLHLNITSKQYDKLLLNRIETILCDWLVQNGGSISAEHGIGFHKAHLMHGSKSSNSLAMMRSIKAHFDPKVSKANVRALKQFIT